MILIVIYTLKQGRIIKKGGGSSISNKFVIQWEEHRAKLGERGGGVGGEAPAKFV